MSIRTPACLSPGGEEPRQPVIQGPLQVGWGQHSNSCLKNPRLLREVPLFRTKAASPSSGGHSVGFLGLFEEGS